MRANEFITEGKKNRRDKRHTIKPRGPETHAEPDKKNESREVSQLKVAAEKPRNFVAKNAKMGGAGAHRDKKKEQKQGYEKHKSKSVEEDESPALAQTAKRLTDPKDGAVDKIRAAGDKRREEHLKSRDIAKKNEDAAGVGIITKQNTTKDVNKGTPRKNLKAFKLV